MFEEFLKVSDINEIKQLSFILCNSNLYEISKTFLNNLFENLDPSLEDVNTISRICKGHVDSIRKSWKTIYLSEQKERGKGRDDRSTPLLEYRKKLETELTEFCKLIIDLIEKKFIKTGSDTTIKALLYRMIGDYWRYLAEIQRGYERGESTKNALSAYELAKDLIESCCGPAAAIRLSIMLNYSIFYFEILSNPDEALLKAQKTYEEGISCVDSLHESAYADSILMLQTIHRTILAWKLNK